MNKTGIVKVGPEARSVLKSLRQKRSLRYVDAVEALARGWALLTNDQQEKAIQRTEPKKPRRELAVTN